MYAADPFVWDDEQTENEESSDSLPYTIDVVIEAIEHQRDLLR